MDDLRVVLVADAGKPVSVLAGGRSFSLWRALCQTAETWRLDAGPRDGDWAGRVRPVASLGLGSAVEQLAVAEKIGVVVVATEAWPDLTGFTRRSDRVVIAAPPNPAALTVAALRDLAARVDAIWVRSETERAIVAGVLPAAHVVLIADHFEPVVLDPEGAAAGSVAVLLDPATDDEAAADRYAALAAVIGDRRILASEAMADRIGRGIGRPVVAVADDQAALSGAASGLLIGATPLVALWRAWAAFGSRTIIGVLATDAPSGPVFGPPMDGAAVAVVPARTLQDVAAAIGTTIGDGDAAAVGDRVRRNLGIEVQIDEAKFHPWTRLYHLTLDVSGTVPPYCLGGHITASGGDEGLINAWTQNIIPRPDFPARIRATAMLVPSISPAQVAVIIDAWGWPVARLELGDDIAEERGGLIGMEPLSPSKVAVTYWGDEGATAIQLGRFLTSPPSKRAVENRPSGYRVEADYPFNRPTLTVLPTRGKGQKFTNFPALVHELPVSSVRLERMRNKYAGQSAWLIGNGPSVRLDDLDRIADSNKLCFCFNRFHLAHPNTRLRASFTVTGDQQMIQDFGQDIVDQSGDTVFVASDKPPTLIGDYVWVRQISVFPSLFSQDAARVVTPGGSSLYVAMQIGHYLGIRRWYVYGADFAFRFDRNAVSTDPFRNASGDNNHFIPGYRSGLAWCPPAIENILPSFHAARQLMEMDDGFIRNATRGGYLEVFDRIDFDEALDGDSAYPANGLQDNGRDWAQSGRGAG